MTLFFLLLITVMAPIVAQGDPVFLNPDLAAVLRLNGDGRFATASFEAQAGDSVTFRAASANGSLDVVLEVLDGAGLSIAYADGAGTGEAVIARLRSDFFGRYTVRVNTFNGEGAGEVTVTADVEPRYALTPETPSLRVPVGANQRVLVHLDGFDLPRSLEITISDPTGRLDPRLEVVNARVVLMSNDDHGTADPSLNRFDARLTAEIPAGAMLLITDFLGRPGWLDVSIRP